MTEPAKPGWLGRNWKWAVPVGCLMPILCCGGGIFALVFSVVAGIKSSDVYKEALAKAQASAAVTVALGSPIEPGSFPQGSIEVSGPGGHANIQIPISGPKGSGTIYAVADKSAGKWEFKTLEVEVDSNKSRINLLKGE